MISSFSDAEKRAARLRNDVLATLPVQHDADLLFQKIMHARGSFDIFDDLLATSFVCSSCLPHLLLFSGCDEPTTQSYQIELFGPTNTDVRQ
jgi:hypothetical protein